MLKKIKIIKNIFNNIKLDENEEIFTKSYSTSVQIKTAKEYPSILVQMPMDYYHLCCFALAINKIGDNHRVIGVWPYNVLPSPKVCKARYQDIKDKIISRVTYFLLSLKWFQLYRAIGCSSFFRLTEVSIFHKIGAKKEARRIFRELSSKQDVLNLTINEIYCGDLIYDTYLRYRSQATIDLKDKFLCEIIYYTILAIKKTDIFFEHNIIDIFLTSYSSYIHHGIPVRVALKYGITVYSDGNLSQYYKQLTLDDYLHTARAKDYYSRFLESDEREAKLDLAEMLLEKRFSGEVDGITSYMKKSAYTRSGEEKLPSGSYDGVVFLHDFFDSPHCYSWMVFNDFMEWAEYTFELIIQNKLRIAIKPHPNQRPESLLVVSELRAKYPELEWISPDTSNFDIFNSEIKFGISIYGTVLHELAYHGIIPIAAGDHPHISFDFVYTALNKEEYKKLILRADKLTLNPDSKEQVKAFYYMHSFSHKDAIDTGARQLNLRSLNPDKSESLIQFLNTQNS